MSGSEETTAAFVGLAVLGALLALLLLWIGVRHARRGQPGLGVLVVVWGVSFLASDLAYAAVLSDHLHPPAGRRITLSCAVVFALSQLLLTRLLSPEWVAISLDAFMMGTGAVLIGWVLAFALTGSNGQPGTRAYVIYVAAAAFSLCLLAREHHRLAFPRAGSGRLLLCVTVGRLVGASGLVLSALGAVPASAAILVLAAAYAAMLVAVVSLRGAPPDRLAPRSGRLRATAPSVLVAACAPIVLVGLVNESELRRAPFVLLYALMCVALCLRQVITARSNAGLLSRLAAGEELYRSLVQDSSDVTMIVAPDGRLEYVSPVAQRVLGRPAEALTGGSAAEVLAVPAAVLAGAAQRVLATGAGERLESRPSPGLVLESVLSRLDHHLLINVRDMTERADMRERLQRMAYHDELTGLPNWHRMNEEIAAALDGWSAGTAPSEPALLFVDLDRFKSVNDAAGHAAGDSVLRVVADRLRRAVPADGVLGRIGGDEFAVLLGGAAAADPEAVADAIVRMMAEPVETDHGSFAIGASVGIALASGARDGSDLLRHADLAMYEAKRELRPWHRYDPGLHTVAVARAAMDRNYAAILDHEDLVVRFQPVVSLATGELVSCEALLRWRDPEGRLGEPQGLLEYAARTGRMYDVARWVLGATLDEALRWRAEGRPAVPVAVNLSSGDVLQPGLADLVRSELARRGLPPTVLSLELTEQALLADPTAAAAACQELRDIGVVVAIDDFGTGFSSLAYLVDLPVDVLKIDRTFTRSLDRAGAARVVFASIVHMARELGLVVVAEGIETEDQRALALAAGVQYGQGYLLGGLLTGEELGALGEGTLLPAPRPDDPDEAAGPDSGEKISSSAVDPAIGRTSCR